MVTMVTDIRTRAAAVALSIGTLAWMLTVAGRRELWAFVALCALAAVALGSALPSVSPWLIGGALVAGPFVIARWTIWRGDDDGLWAMIYFLLIGLGVVLGALATIRRGRARPRGIPTAGALGLLALTAVAVWAGWPPRHFDARLDRLEDVARSFGTPAGFTETGFERNGAPLCEGCEPVVVRSFTTTAPGPEGCNALLRAIDGWMNLRATRDRCDLAGGTPEVAVTVRLDAGFPESTLTVVARERQAS